MNSSASAVYKILAFFDAQDAPLTLLEIQNYLGSRASLREIADCIQKDLGDKVANESGLYFLRGQESLVSTQKSRYLISFARFQKAKKYLKFLRHLPYLRAVAISGSLALLNSTPESDIDLLIITKKNRIWLARTLVSSLLHIIGQRRHGLKISNRFCLNHYLVEDYEITDDRNLYTAIEYASLMPVIGEDTLEKFWQKNQWISEYVSQPVFEKDPVFFGFRFSLAQKILERVLDLTLATPLNYFFGIYQKHRIRRQEHILVSDSELSFHPGSRGQRVLSLYKQKIL